MRFSGKVLIVDDEAHIRQFVGLLIRTMSDATVLEAANGQEALEMDKREQPRLILLDVNMPRMDGLETLKALRERDTGACVVMLTSLVNRQTVDLCLQLGAVAYLRKDNPRKEMTAELEKIFADCLGEGSASPFPKSPESP